MAKAKAKANLSLTNGKEALIAGINEGHGTTLPTAQMEIVEPTLNLGQSLIPLHLRAAKNSQVYSGDITRNYTRYNIQELESSLLEPGLKFGYSLVNGDHAKSICDTFMASYKVYINPENVTVTDITETSSKMIVNDYVLYGELELVIFQKRVKLSQHFPADLKTFYEDWYTTPFTNKKETATKTMVYLLEEWLNKYDKSKEKWDLTGVTIKQSTAVSGGMLGGIDFVIPTNHPYFEPETFMVKYGKLYMSTYMANHLPYYQYSKPYLFMDEPIASEPSWATTSLSSKDLKNVMNALVAIPILPIYPDDVLRLGYSKEDRAMFIHIGSYTNWFFQETRSYSTPYAYGYWTKKTRQDLETVFTGDEFNMFEGRH